ncbi:uncharacterized protein UTRI_01264 [Ustilago trichophora]|uniref:Uncharacterized protein n=1 Tax=Ustilago trichophora TaxID=86804 RepID=A0A5C3DZB7_9BASI|nr:uncharacterized protein UTRI_01264 [Ustilago trichophora]
MHAADLIRTSPVAPISYHTISPSAHSAQNTSTASHHIRTFSSTARASVSAHRKQAGREKARLRSMRMEEKILRRREKDNPSPPYTTPRRPKDPIEEDVESSIREYMARTGPRGERLTLAQQERLLKQDLKGLGHQLEKIEKKEKADEATANLPELDDQVLDELYQALMLPPPPTREEARLARLEGDRREKSLLVGRGRGEMISLPPSAAEKRRVKGSMDLKQKLIHAREKGRMLLPPSPSSPSKASREVELEPQDEGLSEQEQLDLAALPYAERQYIRLQQLFARLALTHGVEADAISESESGAESLQEIKSSLASRIARILQEHDYELHPSVQQAQAQAQAQAQESTEATGEQPEEALPPFKAIRLDGKAPTLDASTTKEPDQKTDISLVEDNSDLVARAESMISNLSSTESRTFMLDGIERLVRAAARSISEPAPARLPLGVATIDEWTALAVSSARAGDTSTLDRTMALMHLSGYHPPPQSLYNDVLDAFATRGDVAACQQWVSQMTEQGVTLDDHTYHSLTKAYVNTAQFAPALELLNSLETSGRPASMATYTLVINRLLVPVSLPGGVLAKEERPELQALAWNLFYHMRLHAHPIPDAPLYALMIRACARGIPQPSEVDDPTLGFSSLSSPNSTGSKKVAISDAERALDLFREMTTRYNVRPNAEVYNSLILACARRKDFYLEAFRLLREMVELETERSHLSSSSDAGERVLRFAPDRYTFNALLQGCARNRDLARARWVLAEMIRTTLPLFDEEVRRKLGRAEVIELLSKRPNEESMCHIFHTYASHVPPVKRADMQMQQSSSSSDSPAKFGDVTDTSASSTAEKPVDQVQSTDAAQSQPTSKLQLVERTEKEDGTTAEEAAQVFSAMVPQTSSDLVSESRSLFARILADQPNGAQEGPLGGVSPGLRLVNAYLTVLAAHLPVHQRAHVLLSTLETGVKDAEGLECGLFRRLGLEANEHSFRVILESLSDGPMDNSGVVEEVWMRFEDFLAVKTKIDTSSSGAEIDLAHKATTGQETLLVDAVQVKKCWSAYLHFLAKHSNEKKPEADGLDKAIATLRRFVSLYPPQLGPKKSRQARKRALDSLLTNQTTLPLLDLTPLPVPVKSLISLQALQNLSSGIPAATANGQGLEKAQGENQIQTAIHGMTGRPTLNFLDVQLLHHRLVRYGRVKDLAFLSWVLHRYNAATRS